jgi:hypothetical protein
MGSGITEIVDSTVGKGSVSETGLNVAFVVGYGRIPQRLRGTESEARLHFVDAAETIVQLVVPNSVGSGYFPVGGDFTSLIDGSAANMHTLFGSRVSGFVQSSTNHGSIPMASAVLDPPSMGGPIYRLFRQEGFCDYIQDLNAVTASSGAANAKENIRASPLSGVQTAIAQLQAALLADHPTVSEAPGC